MVPISSVYEACLHSGSLLLYLCWCFPPRGSVGPPVVVPQSGPPALPGAARLQWCPAASSAAGSGSPGSGRSGSRPLARCWRRAPLLSWWSTRGGQRKGTWPGESDWDSYFILSLHVLYVPPASNHLRSSIEEGRVDGVWWPLARDEENTHHQTGDTGREERERVRRVWVAGVISRESQFDECHEGICTKLTTSQWWSQDLGWSSVPHTFWWARVIRLSDLSDWQTPSEIYH